MPDTIYDTDGKTVKTQGVTTNDIKGISIGFYPHKTIRNAIARNRLNFEFNGVKRALA